MARRLGQADQHWAERKNGDQYRATDFVVPGKSKLTHPQS